MDQEKEPKIVIIGAGIAGISAAKILFDHGMRNVTILEATNRIGGRIHTTDFGTIFYHVYKLRNTSTCYWWKGLFCKKDTYL